jgi:hypothetical protein
MDVRNEKSGQYDFIPRSAIAPPPTIIRYNRDSFNNGELANGPIALKRELGTIEVGKNWQTLALVRRMSAAMGLEAPNCYNELNENHFALAIMYNKISNSTGRRMPLINPANLPQAPVLDGYAGLNTPQPQANTLMFRSVVQHSHPQVGFETLAYQMAITAQNQVLMESFLDPENINAMINEINTMLGGKVDKDFLNKAMTDFANDQKDRFNRRLSDIFAEMAAQEAKWTYNLFSPGYDITNSPNFAQYKQSLIQLMEDMYKKAINTIQTGNLNQNINTLWDNMWTNDRIFNIAGQNLTMRQMDDQRTFLITGSHRRSQM